MPALHTFWTTLDGLGGHVQPDRAGAQRMAATATGTGKNSANAGSRIAPRPKPEYSVRAEASAATTAMTTREFNRTAIARYGLSIKEVADLIAIGLGGREAGTINEGDRRFDVVVRLLFTTNRSLLVAATFFLVVC